MDEQILENVAAQLQQRIGEITSNYETQVALIRANNTVEQQALNDEIKRLKERISELEVLAEAREAVESTD